MKKFGVNGQLRNKLFLIVIHRFSLVRAAMNALRICKMRKGVTKRPQFLLFSTSQVRIEYLRSYLNCCTIVNWKIRKRSHTLKGSQRMGGGRIFIKKTAVPLSLMTTFRMSLISAGSISLDSTFKRLFSDNSTQQCDSVFYVWVFFASTEMNNRAWFWSVWMFNVK